MNRSEWNRTRREKRSYRKQLGIENQEDHEFECKTNRFSISDARVSRAALIVVAVIRQSFVSKVVTGEERDKTQTGRETFETRCSRTTALVRSTVASDEDVR